MIRVNNHNDGYAIANLAGVHWFHPEQFTCIAKIDDSYSTLGGVLYEKWRKGGSVEVHFAAVRKGWVSRTLLWMAFDYPFNQLECRKVIGFTPSSKVDVLAILRRVGFMEETFIADVFPDGSGMTVSSMYKRDCKWLIPPKPGIMERVVKDG